MRDKYQDLVERGRIKDGQFATNSGDKCGAFFLSCPITGTRLKVIAGDGADWQAAGLPGEAWEHVSISTQTRCPVWSEMCWIKDLFFGQEECVVQFHPPKSNYVNDHPFVLHLWKPVKTPILLPPGLCV